MAETPAPSSRMVEEGVRRVESGDVGEESQFAKRGVIFHTTEAS
jgi:hypothetical protein